MGMRISAANKVKIMYPCADDVIIPPELFRSPARSRRATEINYF